MRAQPVIYDESLFAGTATYYARYRPPYPTQLINDIAGHYSLNGKGRLLDLGCGPGTLTLPLAKHFSSVVALDIDTSMIEEGRRIAASFSQFRGNDIDWRAMPAEAISPEMGTFRLVTCGSSFHWMDRDLVLQRIEEVLEPGCGIALVGGSTGWIDGPEDWHQTITNVIRSFIGESRHHFPSERFQQTLERNGWPIEMERSYPIIQEWDADLIIGQLWSTSFANRSRFGDKVDEFEAELRAELLKLHPDGRFREKGDFGLVCSTPPR